MAWGGLRGVWRASAERSILASANWTTSGAAGQGSVSSPKMMTSAAHEVRRLSTSRAPGGMGGMDGSEQGAWRTCSD
eukprot:8289365-Pyramimonas_sp.AAC.1